MSRPGSQETCLTRSGRSGRSGRSCRSGLRLGYSTYFMSSFMPQPRLQSFWLEKKIILTNSVLSRSFSAWPMKGGHHTYFPGTPWNQHKTPWWCNTLNIYQEISVQASKWCAVHISPDLVLKVTLVLSQYCLALRRGCCRHEIVTENCPRDRGPAQMECLDKSTEIYTIYNVI